MMQEMENERKELTFVVHDMTLLLEIYRVDYLVVPVVFVPV